MVDEAEGTKEVRAELEQIAAGRARDRAKAATWNLDIAVFLFAILIIIIMLLFQDISIEIVAPVALFGLVMVWLVGWRRGRQLYQRYYDDELLKLRQETESTVKTTAEESIEEIVQKALREKYQ
jgi:predicted membrane chloride channel (bestrophin family)